MNLLFSCQYSVFSFDIFDEQVFLISNMNCNFFDVLVVVSVVNTLVIVNF